MAEIIGTSNRVLEIDLSTQQVVELKITDQDRQLYMGGKGLGLKFLYERLKPGVNPLGEENIIALMMGVIMGTGATCSGRFVAITKSPLTGILVSSSCGGPFGMAVKTAGYDGLLIKGMADRPCYLEITADGVQFHDGQGLWGKDTEETQQALGLNKTDGALVIGPAGENQVWFANVRSGSRYLGRGGIGAVFGAKRVKAIVARGGKFKIVPKNVKLFQKVHKKAVKQINENLITGTLYRKYGTAANFKFCQRGNIVPVENFRFGNRDLVDKVTGEAMADQYRTQPYTCIPCSILCGHKGSYPDGNIRKIPEYETTAMLGPNLGIFDTDLISVWNDQCGRLGLDTISTGVTLAFAMEAGELGLIKTNLKFGSPNGIAETIEEIAYRRGFGAELANGTRWLSEKYGGKEFAMQVKGMEFPAYDPRGSWGQGLSYAVANRGPCHLSATTFALEVFLNYLNPNSTRARADYVTLFEAIYNGVNSLHICLFTTWAFLMEPAIIKYTPTPILRFVMQTFPWLAKKFMDLRVFCQYYESVTGIKMNPKKFLTIGHRIHLLERYMNTREGISRKDDTLPDRFLKQPRRNDPAQHIVPLDKMLDRYYQLRGYDENGIPIREILMKYGIHLQQEPLQ
ncbi:MAG: aldehyde ferredoxin oxidoreductase family protein [candidate division KSB1 bacterium]|nr:aldehyde ferredoxin oxidoreductase family protein [candidate division KSB1 bacterium]MDZ7333665.1 aldehyde ferredoxin oxidoreductase family protein [candidate division KSB1 bacterium]MDZ7356113.1 aldehyde ferredoxin oxidoreductase family protein [candidate division KSB1 bacterium]MDZ7398910.1 aldehyde ferredoxin oxidoreductase family protein [candidate division KSB1 bacterium]